MASMWSSSRLLCLAQLLVGAKYVTVPRGDYANDEQYNAAGGVCLANVKEGEGSAAVGGSFNAVPVFYASVGGGNCNTVKANYSGVASGWGNFIHPDSSPE